MKIIIDIGHPAHVHLFKYFAIEMQKKGHLIFFTCREKEFEIELLKQYGFRYKSFGRKYYSSIGKIWGLVEFSFKEILEGLHFKPDLFLSHGSMYAAFASKIFGVPHISMEDTGNMEQIRLYKPFTDVILTPDVLKIDLGYKQVRYSGYHELAYLHPNRMILDELPDGLIKPYVIIRFVAWNATHDVRQKGLSPEQKRKLVEDLSKTHKIIISSEKELDSGLKFFATDFPPSLIHTILKSADLFIGEGATMASEAAVMGTPAIYINSIPVSYVRDLERYGLAACFKNGKGLFEKVNEILSQKKISNFYYDAKEKMISEKIDVTSFLLWFIEKYPESFEIMKTNPDFQNNFH